MFKKIKKQKGLTIIELLIVIILLALLTIAAFITVPTQLKKSRDARRKADLDRIKIALYDYYFDYDCFPENLPNCQENFGQNGMVYLNNFPCDSKGDPYRYVVTKKGGGKCSQWFRLFTNLEVTTDPIIAKIHCSQGCGPDCAYNYGVASTNTQIYRDCYFTYACNPGGNCEAFDDPAISQCPKVFDNDLNCDNQCSQKENRCKNDSGKHIPWEE